MRSKIKLIGILALLTMMSNHAYSQTERDSVKIWAQNAAEEVMTFHFNNFEKKRRQNKSLFTASGYEKFYSALERSKIPQAVSENKYVVETQVLCFPEIVAEPSADNRFYVLKFPYEMTFIQGERGKKDYMHVTMKVADINNQTNNYGIEQWVAQHIKEAEAKACSGDDY